MHCSPMGDQEVPEINWLPDKEITFHEAHEGDCPGMKGQSLFYCAVPFQYIVPFECTVLFQCAVSPSSTESAFLCTVSESLQHHVDETNCGYTGRSSCLIWSSVNLIHEDVQSWTQSVHKLV